MSPRKRLRLANEQKFNLLSYPNHSKSKNIVLFLVEYYQSNDDDDNVDESFVKSLIK